MLADDVARVGTLAASLQGLAAACGALREFEETLLDSLRGRKILYVGTTAREIPKIAPRKFVDGERAEADVTIFSDMDSRVALRSGIRPAWILCPRVPDLIEMLLRLREERAAGARLEALELVIRAVPAGAFTICEFLRLTPDVRALFDSAASVNRVVEQAVSEGMTPARESAERLVKQGILTQEEADCVE